MAKPSVGAFERGLNDLKQFAVRGIFEVQNAIFAGSNVAIPSVVSSAQLQSQYESGLAAAAERAAAEPEKANEMER